MLCCAGSQLLQILRKVCIQIADLSASMALVIARATVDAILTNCLPENPAVQDDKSDAGGSILPTALVCSAHTARILNFLTGIVTHPSLKAAVLQLCRGLQKSDEKYVDFLQILCLILNTTSSSATHIQAQESVVSIFQSLLDADICLLSSDKIDYETYLSAALPSKDPTILILSGLWEHLVGSHSYSSLLLTLRTLMMLTEHNYTFQHMQKILERKDQGGQGSLWPFFSKIASGFSKDSSDCLSTLSTALELLSLMVKTQNPLKDYKDRSLTLPVSSLSAALQWTSEQPHPLVTLYDQLQSMEEGSMDSLKDSLSALITMLQAGTEPHSNKETIPEMVLPSPDTLNLQFSQRPLLSDSLMLDEDRLSSMHWIASQWIDEADMEIDQIRCDLLEASELCINTRIDLVAETERLCKSHTELSDQVEKISVAGSNVPGSGNNAAGFLPPGRAILSTARDKSSKPYVAPMRGRGFGRPGVNSRNDLFRSRAPNTSRPPSLHVDDFVALEKNGSVPATGSGSSNVYGKTRLGGVMVTTRGGRVNRGGRGGFGPGERGGRFVFTPRRDPSGRSPRIATTNRPNASSAKWEDYHPTTGDGRSSSTAARFQSTNRVWTNPKDRYPPSVSSASRTSRHARTFTR